jgi:hypothetical protein
MLKVTKLKVENFLNKKWKSYQSILQNHICKYYQIWFHILMEMSLPIHTIYQKRTLISMRYLKLVWTILLEQ